MLNVSFIPKQLLRRYVTTLLKWFIVCSVVLTYGGGSALLQSAAWASMLSSEMQTAASFSEGVKNAFNGEKPCALCMAAQSLREGDHKAPLDKPDTPKEKKTSSFAKEKISKILDMRFRPLMDSQFCCLRETIELRLSSVHLSVDVPPPKCG